MERIDISACLPLFFTVFNVQYTAEEKGVQNLFYKKRKDVMWNSSNSVKQRSPCSSLSSIAQLVIPLHPVTTLTRTTSQTVLSKGVLTSEKE